MATKYAADLGPALDRSTITESHVAEPTKVGEVTFAAGTSPNDQVLFLRALADYVLQWGDQSGASTATS